jgi:flagellin-like hook-associated protein FlgL
MNRAILLINIEYQAMQEKIEVLEDIQTSITQLAEGKGLTHDVAKSMVKF